jgi:hypothetical protein
MVSLETWESQVKKGGRVMITPAAKIWTHFSFSFTYPICRHTPHPLDY